MLFTKSQLQIAYLLGNEEVVSSHSNQWTILSDESWFNRLLAKRYHVVRISQNSTTICSIEVKDMVLVVAVLS